MFKTIGNKKLFLEGLICLKTNTNWGCFFSKIISSFFLITSFLWTSEATQNTWFWVKNWNLTAFSQHKTWENLLVPNFFYGVHDIFTKRILANAAFLLWCISEQKVFLTKSDRFYLWEDCDTCMHPYKVIPVVVNRGFFIKNPNFLGQIDVVHLGHVTAHIKW